MQANIDEAKRKARELADKEDRANRHLRTIQYREEKEAEARNVAAVKAASEADTNSIAAVQAAAKEAEARIERDRAKADEELEALAALQKKVKLVKRMAEEKIMLDAVLTAGNAAAVTFESI